MTVEVENEVVNATVDTVEQEPTNAFHLLQKTIASMPEIDQAKVQAALKKLQSGGIQILGTPEEQLESAQRIAQKIIDDTTE